MVVRRASKDGYDTICKECSNKYQRQRRGHNDDKKTPVERRKLNENQIVEELLKKLGYELNGELSVHQQFIKKYNLTNND